MSKQVKLRRGTTAQHAAFTGALGEVTLDTDKDVTVVHDGVTAGGVPSGREDRARGWTRTEYFTTAGSATYSTTGKTDLKRIRVTCYGGGAGGSNAGGGGGGGSGGIAIRVMDISESCSREPFGFYSQRNFWRRSGGVTKVNIRQHLAG